MTQNNNARSNSTIAAIMLKSGYELSIPEIADHFLASKLAERACARSVCWDCDDLVFLDFDGIRIALQSVPEAAGQPGFLCLGVGLVPGSNNLLDLDWATLAQNLVKRVGNRLPIQAVLWNEMHGDLNANQMDTFQDELARMIDYLDMMANEFGEAPQVNEISSDACARTARPHVDEDALAEFRSKILHSGSGDNDPAIGSENGSKLRVSLLVVSCTFFYLAPAIGSMLLFYLAASEKFKSFGLMAKLCSRKSDDTANLQVT